MPVRSDSSNKVEKRDVGVVQIFGGDYDKDLFDIK